MNLCYILWNKGWVNIIIYIQECMLAARHDDASKNLATLYLFCCIIVNYRQISYHNDIID